MKYWVAIIGVVALILIIVALAVDILWTLDSADFGWKEVSYMDYTMTYDELWVLLTQGAAAYSLDLTFDLSGFKKRGKVWLAMGIASVVAVTVGIVCIILDKFVTFMSDRMKRILRPIPFAVSAVLILAGSIVVAVYDGDGEFKAFIALGGTDIDVGASPIIGFVAAGIMMIPACLFTLLWFV